MNSGDKKNAAPPIYVEILIKTPLEQLWKYTQQPDLHERWDLRFSHIEYLPRADDTSPRQFLYSTRLGFGLNISGRGETVGERSDGCGSRSSALKFWSEDCCSLIRSGSGYWKYISVDNGIRFLTLYNYDVRFGWVGRWFDRLIFRPMIGWATAWSFDRLRLWLEAGADPSELIKRWVSYVVCRTTLAVIWIYQGLVPKLLYRDSGELEILQHARLFAGYEEIVLSIVGIGEVLFGLWLLWKWWSRVPMILNIVALILLGFGAMFSQPAIYAAPFNPFTLSIAMISLSIVGLQTADRLPRASSCRRARSEKETP